MAIMINGVPSGDVTMELQPVIYSEDERIIGVWIDGKPLYQKTFIKTITCGSEQTLLSATDLQDVDVIVDIFGDYYYMKLEHYDSSNYRSYVTLAGTTVLGYAKWGTTASVEAKVTIQYTKTTDTAGSGTWTPQGVPAVHYSTDEQVVGTWIDGNILYEKTLSINVVDAPADTWTSTSIAVGDINKIIASEFVSITGNNYPALPVGKLNGYLVIRNYLSIPLTYNGNLTLRYTKSST